MTRPRPAPAPPRPAGFTLLEMIVVLAILGLALALVVTRGPPRSPGLDMRAAASLVARSLREARSQAIAANSPTAVTLDPATGSIAAGGRVVRLPPDVALSAPAATVSFAPDGSSSGGTVGLAGAGRRFVVAVNWLTGRVSVTEAP